MYNLVSTVKGKIKVVHSKLDYNNKLVFHGRYANLKLAVLKAQELNAKRGY